MTIVVILDSDFLSAFLKIEQMPLIQSLYQIETVSVPPAVYREIAVTDLLPRLTTISWLKVVAPSAARLTALSADETFRRLGTGEQEAIALALEHTPSILLGNDNQARRIASKFGVSAINIPAFLLACSKPA